MSRKHPTDPNMVDPLPASYENDMEEKVWVRITRSGDNFFFEPSWYVQVGHGGLSWGPDGGGWFAWTEAGAIRKAKLKVEALNRNLAKRKKIEWKEDKK